MTNIQHIRKMTESLGIGYFYNTYYDNVLNALEQAQAEIEQLSNERLNYKESMLSWQEEANVQMKEKMRYRQALEEVYGTWKTVFKRYIQTLPFGRDYKELDGMCRKIDKTAREVLEGTDNV